MNASFDKLSVTGRAQSVCSILGKLSFDGWANIEDAPVARELVIGVCDTAPQPSAAPRRRLVAGLCVPSHAWRESCRLYVVRPCSRAQGPSQPRRLPQLLQAGEKE